MFVGDESLEEDKLLYIVLGSHGPSPMVNGVVEEVRWIKICYIKLGQLLVAFWVISSNLYIFKKQKKKMLPSGTDTDILVIAGLLNVSKLEIILPSNRDITI